MNKKIIIIAATILALIIASLYYFTKSNSENIKTPVETKVETKRVFISKTTDNPALDSTVKGIVDELEAKGYIQDKNLDLVIESAQANAPLAQQIAAKFVSQQPDIIIGVGTTAAKSFMKYTTNSKTKFIFTAISDPLTAGLVSNLEKPGGNITGVADALEQNSQIKFLQIIKTLQPGITNIGFIYNPSELNSLFDLKQLETLLPKENLSLVLQTVNRTSDVPQAATRLAGASDAILVVSDATALSAISSIVKAVETAQIPLYVEDIDAVKVGAVAALGVDQYDVGKQTADMIIDIWQGANISDMSVQLPRKTALYLNLDAAKKANITIPDAILKEASSVIGDNK